MTRKAQFIAMSVLNAVAIGGGIWLTVGHPLRGPDVVTIAGVLMLVFAWASAAYFEITRMRTDEQGRRYYYPTVWDWFQEIVLKRPT